MPANKPGSLMPTSWGAGKCMGCCRALLLLHAALPSLLLACEWLLALYWSLEMVACLF